MELRGERDVEMKLSALADGNMKGVKYGGYIVTVKDERGLVVQYKTTHEFLFEQMDNLKNIPIGKHFNKNCMRVMPPKLKPTDRFSATL